MRDMEKSWVFRPCRSWQDRGHEGDFGILSTDSGCVCLDGKQIDIRRPRDAIRAGIAYIPEDRKNEGLILINSVAFNMTLAALNEIIRGIRVNKKKEPRW